jgi:hypothetical protein
MSLAQFSLEVTPGVTTGQLDFLLPHRLLRRLVTHLYKPFIQPAIG